MVGRVLTDELDCTCHVIAPFVVTYSVIIEKVSSHGKIFLVSLALAIRYVISSI